VIQHLLCASFTPSVECLGLRELRDAVSGDLVAGHVQLTGAVLQCEHI